MQSRCDCAGWLGGEERAERCASREEGEGRGEKGDGRREKRRRREREGRRRKRAMTIHLL